MSWFTRSTRSCDLTRAIEGLALAMRDQTQQCKFEFDWTIAHHNFATKQDVLNLTHKIMSKISDFAAKQNAFNDRLDAAITGLQGDIKTLNDAIQKLQTSQGQITPEDQALLDQIEARADGIATKLEALDNLTPPAATETQETPENPTPSTGGSTSGPGA